MLAIICMRSGLDHQTEPPPIGPAPGNAFANFAERKMDKFISATLNCRPCFDA